MASRWTPVVGQLVLIEPEGSMEVRCLTGIVLDADGPVVIDLGGSPRPTESECQVRASFFDPEALYLVTATARSRDESPTVLDLTVQNVQRIQRRASRRVRSTYPVALTAFDQAGDFVAVVGETIDLSPGGCRVVTPSPLPGRVEPAVSVNLPGSPVVALGRVLEVHVDAASYEYRLAFTRIAESDVERLKELTAPLSV